ncbi:hypothetical protein EJ03DRAFT_273198, partial [Teratosphaeria nubilosa]
RSSSSEEKDTLKPAQSRRKDQSRAAYIGLSLTHIYWQRAFTERKERHIRDLEAKIRLLTTTTSILQSDNERLKLMPQQVQTENGILRATAPTSPPLARMSTFVDDPAPLPRPRSRNNAEPGLELARSRGPSTTSTCTSPVGIEESHLLSTSETWNVLRSNPFYLSGAIDLGQVAL